MSIKKIKYFLHTIKCFLHIKIVCKLISDPAIQALGLVSGIKYNLGIAKEGVDFFSVYHK